MRLFHSNALTCRNVCAGITCNGLACPDADRVRRVQVGLLPVWREWQMIGFYSEVNRLAIVGV